MCLVFNISEIKKKLKDTFDYRPARPTRQIKKDINFNFMKEIPVKKINKKN